MQIAAWRRTTKRAPALTVALDYMTLAELRRAIGDRRCPEVLCSDGAGLHGAIGSPTPYPSKRTTRMRGCAMTPRWVPLANRSLCSMLALASCRSTTPRTQKALVAPIYIRSTACPVPSRTSRSQYDSRRLPGRSGRLRTRTLGVYSTPAHFHIGASPLFPPPDFSAVCDAAGPWYVLRITLTDILTRDQLSKEVLSRSRQK